MYFLYVLLMITFVVCNAAQAGTASAPELDSATLSSLAAAFTGCYAAFRIYRAKKK